jgi:phytoene dehydrogenase-like protein
MTDAIEGQIERFAPGFRQLILARHATTPADLERYNANYVGGAITGGVADLAQLFTRPVARLNPYTTPNPRVLICSASTPPGGGVHGMCGYHAARTALARLHRFVQAPLG